MALIKCKACGNEISKKAEACPKCGEKPRRTTLLTWIVLIIAVGWIFGQIASSNSPVNSSGVSTLSPTETAINNIKLDFSWGKEGFGNVMIANFTIHNNGSQDVKDIKIKCTHSAASGTVIDENTQTIYELFKAKSKKTIRNFNMGFIHSQASKSGCEIVDLTVL